MDNVIPISRHRRPASATRIYINPPSREALATTKVWRDMADQAELAKHQPERLGAYLRGKAESGAALSQKQARELALLTRADLATNPEAREMLLRKADQLALRQPSPMSLPTLDGGFDYRGCEFKGPRLMPCLNDPMPGQYDPLDKPVSLVPLMIGLLAFGALISIWPVAG